MARVWVRWLLLAAFVVALGFTFVSLGNWQLDRLDQRRDRNASVVAHEQADVLTFEQAFSHAIAETDQWQRVRVTGTFLADKQLQVRYRSFADQTGWELVTPLRTTTGATVLVDRGFIARPANEDFPKTYPAPPTGQVEVLGYVRRNEVGKPNATTPAEGTVRLIDSEAIAAWLGEPLVNGYISAITLTPPQGAELQPITPPSLDEGPHLSYALQWFSFAAIAGFGLGLLIRNDLRDRKKAQTRAAKAAAQAHAHEAVPDTGAAEAAHEASTPASLEDDPSPRAH